MKPAVSILGTGAAVLLLAVAVQAGDKLPPVAPGQPGLYEHRIFSNMAMFIARDLSKVPAAEQQRLSGESLARPGPVTMLCADAAIAKSLDKQNGMAPGCSFENVQGTAHGFTTDVRCPGRNEAMHYALEAESPGHLVMTVSMAGMPGATVPLINRYDLRWISADCGALKPGEVRMPDRKIVTPR